MSDESKLDMILQSQEKMGKTLKKIEILLVDIKKIVDKIDVTHIGNASDTIEDVNEERKYGSMPVKESLTVVSILNELKNNLKVGVIVSDIENYIEEKKKYLSDIGGTGTIVSTLNGFLEILNNYPSKRHEMRVKDITTIKKEIDEIIPSIGSV